MAHGTTARAWAVGGTVFAAVMMIILGIWQIIIGIAAIARSEFFVVAPNYVYEIDTTAWGWVHLGIGVLALLAGLFLFTGALWARIVGIALALLSAVANFFFLPYYPLWSLAVIALDVFVIWALASVGRAMSDRDYGAERYGSAAGRPPERDWATADRDRMVERTRGERDRDWERERDRARDMQ